MAGRLGGMVGRASATALVQTAINGGKLRKSWLLLLPLLLMNLQGKKNDERNTCSSHRGIVYRIARQEGWHKKGSLVRRLRNPGALVYAHQYGARRHRSGFAYFDSEALGWRALDRDVELKLARGKSLKKAWAYL